MSERSFVKNALAGAAFLCAACAAVWAFATYVPMADVDLASRAAYHQSMAALGSEGDRAEADRAFREIEALSPMWRHETRVNVQRQLDWIARGTDHVPVEGRAEVLRRYYGPNG